MIDAIPYILAPLIAVCIYALLKNEEIKRDRALELEHEIMREIIRKRNKPKPNPLDFC